MAVLLNDAQRDAVEAQENILCCACPGSGKTRVLIRKVAHVLATHPAPRIVMTTFSRDAANEMRRRIEKDSSIPTIAPGALVIGTFHALALRQLKSVSKVDKILSDIEARHLIARALDEIGSDISIDDADAEIARCKADRDYAKANPELRELTLCYLRHQREAGASDFTDILLRANALMEAGTLPPIPATHFFADEFQDIDAIQFNWLLLHLRQNPIACAVGDDDQSIYGFRRSLGYQGMMDFCAATGARLIQLDTNYRSTEGIVSSASRLISNNVDRVRKNIRAHRGPGPLPVVVKLAKKESVGSRIVECLDGICANNPRPALLPDQKPFRFTVKPEQAAVLARSNAQLHQIENTFREAGVPFLRSGRSFWDAPVLQVYVALLKSLLSKDSLGFEIALRWTRMPDSMIHALAGECGGSLWPLFDPKQNAPAGIETRYGFAVADLIELGRGWADKLRHGDSPRSAMAAILGAAAWMERVKTGACQTDDDGQVKKSLATRDLRDLDKLKAARDTLADIDGNLAQRLYKLEQTDDKDIPRVILTTFHSSKGLEWDHVFLIEFYAGSVPKADELSSEEEWEEERRVAYVAMTRARDHLTIFTRAHQPASEFLADAGLVRTNPEVNPDHTAALAAD